MSKNQTLNKIPLAYFITFTCYGTWLHGEKTTSVDQKNSTFGHKFVPKNELRYESAKQRQKETPYILDEPRRVIILKAIVEVCTSRQWVLFAAHVRTNHIHIIVHAIEIPEHITNSIKAYSSRYLNDSRLDGNRKNRWSRHGSTRYLWNENEVESTIQYVIHEQGEPMALIENTERSCDLESRKKANVEINVG